MKIKTTLNSLQHIWNLAQNNNKGFLTLNLLQGYKKKLTLQPK